MDPRKPLDESPAAQWLTEVWTACLTQAVEGMAGERPSVAPETGEDAAGQPASGEGVLWWEQGFDLEGQPLVWIGAPEIAWRETGKRILSAAGIEDAPPEEARGTWTEILGQAVSALAQALGARLERSVAAVAGREVDGPPSEESCWRRFQISFPDSGPAPFRIGFSAALLKALDPGESAVELVPMGAAPSDQEAVMAQLPQASRTLDLLREVELPVSISFGRAEMALRDVLKLTAGSVVELDRAIDDPVELIVNDTVVALGEVVVIEGNYGLRIQRIMSRENLLRSSGVA